MLDTIILNRQSQTGQGSPLERLKQFDHEALLSEGTRYFNNAVDWLQTVVMRPENLTQLVVVLGVLVAGFILARPLKRLAVSGVSRLPANARRLIETPAPRLVQPLVWTLGFLIAQSVLSGSGQSAALVRVATSLAMALLIIQLATSFVPREFRKPVTWFAWLVAALNAFELLQPTMDWLDSNGVPFGDQNITLPFVVRAIVFSALFLFSAGWLSRQLRTRIDTLPRIEPSVRTLISNATHVALFFAAAVLALTSLGIPLGGLAVLGGALGVGLGFGMQQIVANFVSGVILLTDRSIKPDDVIEVDDTYGVVKSLGLRYASVVTRDGKEHLIPNEQLVANKVVNWSYSNNRVRIKRRLRVEYESDLRLACSLVVEGCRKIDRVLADPEPKCLVMEFGDEAVEIEARFWIEDPQNGVNNVASEVMLAVWDLFKAHGIDIPLRQEEILIQPGSVMNVKILKDHD